MTDSLSLLKILSFMVPKNFTVFPWNRLDCGSVVDLSILGLRQTSLDLRLDRACYSRGCPLASSGEYSPKLARTVTRARGLAGAPRAQRPVAVVEVDLAKGCYPPGAVVRGSFTRALLAYVRPSLRC